MGGLSHSFIQSLVQKRVEEMMAPRVAVPPDIPVANRKNIADYRQWIEHLQKQPDGNIKSSHTIPFLEGLIEKSHERLRIGVEETRSEMEWGYVRGLTNADRALAEHIMDFQQRLTDLELDPSRCGAADDRAGFLTDCILRICET